MTAAPIDADMRLRTAAEAEKISPWFEPAFYDRALAVDPVDILAARAAVWYWPATGLDPLVSDLLTGSSGVIDLGQTYIGDSLVLATDGSPLKAVELELTASWTQRVSGLCDITSRIRAAFGGPISTYTPRELEATWPALGQSLGTSGWRVVDSELEPIDTRLSAPIPTLRFKQPWLVSPDTGAQLYQIVTQYGAIERVDYHGQVLMGCEYRQRRQEVARVTVSADLQSAVAATAVERISLRLDAAGQCLNFTLYQGRLR